MMLTRMSSHKLLLGPLSHEITSKRTQDSHANSTLNNAPRLRVGGSVGKRSLDRIWVCPQEGSGQQSTCVHVGLGDWVKRGQQAAWA